MNGLKVSEELLIVASQHKKEEDYWLNCLSENNEKVFFPYDYDIKPISSSEFKRCNFTLSEHISNVLLRWSTGSDIKLFYILVSALVVLTYKHTGKTNIVLGIPIFKQEAGGNYINTKLPIKCQVNKSMSLKELILAVKSIITQAVEHQNYPMEILVEKLGIRSDIDFSLFDFGILLENIQDESLIQNVNLLFQFRRVGSEISGYIRYNAALYLESTIEQIAKRFEMVLKKTTSDVNNQIADINILLEEEKQSFLNFNQTYIDFANDLLIHQRFEEQVSKTPGEIAIICEDKKITYENLNLKANQLARYLISKGITRESIVGIMLDRTIDSVISMLAILKVGGAYLPIDPNTPTERIDYFLRDSGSKILLTKSYLLDNKSFTTLENFSSNAYCSKIINNPLQKFIEQFDKLPIPDRSLIDVSKYKNKIGMASVTNCITIQSTRGCPYECFYCHKIWSKHHVYRTAESIFEEIKFYNGKGVKNFAFVDDVFNLNQKNGTRLFDLIISNHLEVQLFFPNGLRGDILTPAYVDKMVEAGTRGINLSLETASPRLQKLLKKNLDLDKFHLVVDYIATEHPEVILELATMHGFPTETENEAMMTLDFIKSIKWLHFPYIHILKIFPNTEMEEFALEQGISKQDILISRDRAFHELPETLPFPKSFTRRYQAIFMNDYFLSKERLKHVLPTQLTLLHEEALTQKYNAYLPIEISSIKDIVSFAGLDDFSLPGSIDESTPILFQEKRIYPVSPDNKRRILLLDLSQHFSSHKMLYKVTEQPLGLLSLLTYLNCEFKGRIEGRIYKSGVDFDNFGELQKLFDEFSPDLIGIRSLTYYREFFHETVSLLRSWGFNGLIVAGGPYASSDYDTLLLDKNVDLAVRGEGEFVFEKLLGALFENDFKLPKQETLLKIDGLAFPNYLPTDSAREILMLDLIEDQLSKENIINLGLNIKPTNLAYVMYTSGSTGTPKGVIVEHRQVNNCIDWMQSKYKHNRLVVAGRTDFTFDPSVWEIFWPLYNGGTLHLLSDLQCKNADFLVSLMENATTNVMYLPSPLLAEITRTLIQQHRQATLRTPFLFIGAEMISKEIVNAFYAFFDGLIINTYGPTECTINNTYYEINHNDQKNLVPIGQPIANNQIYILSKDLDLLPLGVTGEIYIAGDSVSRGYINDPIRTKDVFLENPFGSGKLYKSGDLGRWNIDGTVEILGRIDDQVKVRGYRIELKEIQDKLLENPDIEDCVVIVHDPTESDVKVCKKCGVTTNYPRTQINDEGICNICENLTFYKRFFDAYFKSLDDLRREIIDANREKSSKYDCIVLYAGGLGAAYALYNLVSMGFSILAITYDNGYLTKKDLENINEITSGLGVDHIILKHQHSDKILLKSLISAQTTCRGCFHTSFSLASKYAIENNIQVIVGATLSKGQIIDGKLSMYLNEDLGPDDLDSAVKEFQKQVVSIDREIFNLIDIEDVSNLNIYSKIKFFDFYRYCDVSNEQIISYLEEKSSYWKTRRKVAIYSTNCPIKHIGDMYHVEAKGFHYYGNATSWEKRLNHIKLENVEQDLQYHVTRTGYLKFLQKLGLEHQDLHQRQNKYVCAYYITKEEVTSSTLREYLLTKLPLYMVPAYFVQIDKIPLTVTGKIDRKSLPSPTVKNQERIPPRNDVENQLVAILADVMEIEHEKIGVFDNFFELGGDSLQATRVITRVREIFGIDIPLQSLFEGPQCVSSLAERIEKILSLSNSTDTDTEEGVIL